MDDDFQLQNILDGMVPEGVTDTETYLRDLIYTCNGEKVFPKEEFDDQILHGGELMSEDKLKNLVRDGRFFQIVCEESLFNYSPEEMVKIINSYENRFDLFRDVKNKITELTKNERVKKYNPEVENLWVISSSIFSGIFENSEKIIKLFEISFLYFIKIISCGGFKFHELGLFDGSTGPVSIVARKIYRTILFAIERFGEEWIEKGDFTGDYLSRVEWKRSYESCMDEFGKSAYYTQVYIDFVKFISEELEGM